MWRMEELSTQRQRLQLATKLGRRRRRILSEAVLGGITWLETLAVTSAGPRAAVTGVEKMVLIKE